MDYNIDLKEDAPDNFNNKKYPSKDNAYQIEQSNQQQNLQNHQKVPEGCTKFLSIEFYQQFFKVSQQEVMERIKLSFVPMKRDFIEKIKDNADFYGPFWVLTTLIFLLGSTSNLSSYFINWTSSDFIFKLQLIRYGVLIVYPFGFGVPTLVYFILKFMGSNKLSLSQLICLYGYSFSCFIVIFILCIIPSSILQWMLMVYGMVNTVAFLILNLIDYLQLNQIQKYVIFGVIASSQIVLFLTFKLLFFKLIYVEALQTNPDLPNN